MRIERDGLQPRYTLLLCFAKRCGKGKSKKDADESLNIYSFLAGMCWRKEDLAAEALAALVVVGMNGVQDGVKGNCQTQRS